MGHRSAIEIEDMPIANTGSLTCDVCNETYDYAPGSPLHFCAQSGEHERGIRAGMAMAAAILVRDLDSPTHALEILGAAGIDAKSIATLGLDAYDLKPLKAIL